MVVEQILRQLEFLSIAFEAFHYRSSGGKEVDLILEGHFGIIAIEIKMGTTVKSNAVKKLSEFLDEYNIDFGIIISNSDKCFLLKENIINIPANMI